MKTMLTCIAAVVLLAPLYANPVAKIGLVIGKVEVREPQQRWTKAVAGMPMSAKAELQTGPKGKAVLQFANGSSVEVRPGTLLSIASYTEGSYGSATDIGLRMGSMRAIVSKRVSEGERNHFRVRTPTAVAGVRGTIEDITHSSSTGTVVILVESSADVIGRNGVATVVNQGDAVISNKGGVVTPDDVSRRQNFNIREISGMSADEADSLLRARDPVIGGSQRDIEILREQVNQITPQNQIYILERL